MTRTRRTTPLLILAGVGLAAVAARSLWAPPRPTWNEEDHLRALDERIRSAMPRDRGQAATPTVVSDSVGAVGLVVALAPVPEGEPEAGRTRITVAGSTRLLPRAASPEADAAFGEVKKAVAALVSLGEAPPAAEIRTSPGVPPSDVMRVMTCLLEAGVTEVNFAAPPTTELPRPRTAPR